MLSPIVEKTIKQLKKKNLTLEDRTALLTAILDKLQVLPLDEVLSLNAGQVSINGKPLEIEQFIAFKDSAIALRDNYAFKVINGQVRYMAVNLGVHKAVTLDQMFFFKAALWQIKEYNDLLEKVIATER